MTVGALCTPHSLCLGGIIKKKHDGTRSSAAVQNHEQYLAVLKIDTASGGVHDNRNSTAVHTAPDAVFFSFAVEVYKSRINAVTAQVEVEPESLRHHSRNTSTAGTQFKVFVEFRNVGARSEEHTSELQ